MKEGLARRVLLDVFVWMFVVNVAEWYEGSSFESFGATDLISVVL